MNEAEAKQEMINRLRLAHESVQMPPGLETRIRAAVKNEGAPRQRTSRLGWRAVGALAMTLLSVGIAYQSGYLRLTRDSQDSYIAAVSNRVASILRPGLKDHIHCALYRKYPAAAPPAEKFVAELGPEYRNLVQVAARQAPAGYKVMIGHKCRYQGRQFVHLALTKGNQVLSLVIAAKNEGESFTTEQLRPALQEGGTAFYQASTQRFAISAFETERYLVYTVSDLPAEQNLRLMAAMAPGVRGVLNTGL